MLIVMEAGATPESIEKVCSTIRGMGFEPRPIPGEMRTAIGIIGNRGSVERQRFLGLPGVKEAIPVSKPYKLVSRELQPHDTVVELPNGAKIGGSHACLMAGPCSVESEAQIFEAAAAVARGGAQVLRGGAFKPRTSPYAFQGLGVQALEWMRAAARRYNLAVTTEAVDEASAELVAEHADIIQIGARNMQNYQLLKKVGSLSRPVLLKRGMSATIEEWLLAAEYILDAGNPEVILCERGIRSFDKATRNVLDLAAIPLVQGLSHLPVIADPSHGTGVKDMVAPMARAALAAGAHGIIVEVHPNPAEALSDGHQALVPAAWDALAGSAAAAAAIGGRELSSVSPR